MMFHLAFGATAGALMVAFFVSKGDSLWFAVGVTSISVILASIIIWAIKEIIAE